MSFQAEPHPELDTLLEDLLEDRLSVADAARLNFLLKSDAQAPDRYLFYMELHSSLLYDHVSVSSLETGSESVEAGMGDAMILPAIRDNGERSSSVDVEYGKLGTTLPEPAPKRSRRFGLLQAWISFAALVLISFAAIWYVASQPEGPIFLAAIDASWDSSQSVPQLGKTMPSREVQLNTGLVRIKFASGTEIILEAPARLKADAVNGVELMAGKLTAVVPPAGHGFTVRCPDATVVDLGTEFGINLHGNGLADVEVFKGTVTLSPRPLAAAGNAVEPPTLTLTAGDARQVAPNQTIIPIPSNAAGWVAKEDFDMLAAAPDPASFGRWRVYSDSLRDNPDLVAYYTFEKSADAPDRLLNQSHYGSSLDGILGGGDPAAQPTWTTGRWPGKGALSFVHGTAEHVALPSSPAIDFSGQAGQHSRAFSICAWIRPSFTGQATGAIICRGHGTYEQYAIDFPPAGFYDGALRAWVRGKSDPEHNIALLLAPVPDQGNWHLVASVYDPDNSNLRLFVDGQLIRERKPPLELLPDGEVNIGSRKDLSNAFDSTFTGSIDELAIFKKPLSPDEISQMFNSGKPE
jgi:hypothetical protein